jgi:2C-methyl-D-erythritol 2,4-cyclodiphosphate synthase
LQINPNQIGLKAKTGEGVGPVGSGQVIEARCIASLTSGEPWYLRPIV